MAQPIRVLELRSVRGTGGGPEKTILLGAARSDPAKAAVTVCYVRDDRDAAFGIAGRARELGVAYEEIRERHSFDLSIWPALVRLIRGRRIDIVHAHDYKSDVIAYGLARITPARPLATAHGWITNTGRERFYARWDQRLLARFPLAIAVSEPIRQAIVARGGDPARVRRIPNGIDTCEFRRDAALGPVVRDALGIPRDAVVIGSIGRLEPEKRLDLLLEAVHRLPPAFAPHVLVVGDGSQRSALERQARALGLEARVRFTGQRADVRDLHHAADVYVQSSASEGFPNALLEAMAIGVPAVATRVGGTPELIDDGVHGLLVPSGDAGAIAAAIERSLVRAEETRTRVAAARARIERELSFDARQAAVERVYDDLLALTRNRR